MQFTVTFNFEAADVAAAEETVGSWTVTAGTTLVGLMGQPEFSANAPLLVEAAGPVADGVNPNQPDEDQAE